MGARYVEQSKQLALGCRWFRKSNAVSVLLGCYVTQHAPRQHSNIIPHGRWIPSPTITPNTPMKIVFVGNPGSGKSTLLNSLLGAPHFASGISIGTGLTTHKQDRYENGNQYVDTPGLDDVLTREVAASEISSALSGTESLLLVFVCTLEAGAVKAADVDTIKAVLLALEQAGAHVRDSFCILVNKCSPNEMEKLTAVARERLRHEFSCGRGTPYIEFVPLVPDATDQSGALVVSREFMESVLQKTRPTQLPAGARVQVQSENFLQGRNRLHGLLRERQGLLSAASAGALGPKTKRDVLKLVGRAVAVLAAIGIGRFLFRKWSPGFIRKLRNVSLTTSRTHTPSLPLPFTGYRLVVSPSIQDDTCEFWGGEEV